MVTLDVLPHRVVSRRPRGAAFARASGRARDSSQPRTAARVPVSCAVPAVARGAPRAPASVR